MNGSAPSIIRSAPGSPLHLRDWLEVAGIDPLPHVEHVQRRRRARRPGRRRHHRCPEHGEFEASAMIASSSTISDVNAGHQSTAGGGGQSRMGWNRWGW